MKTALLGLPRLDDRAPPHSTCHPSDTLVECCGIDSDTSCHLFICLSLKTQVCVDRRKY